MTDYLLNHFSSPICFFFLTFSIYLFDISKSKKRRQHPQDHKINVNNLLVQISLGCSLFYSFFSSLLSFSHSQTNKLEQILDKYDFIQLLLLLFCCQSAANHAINVLVFSLFFLLQLFRSSLIENHFSLSLSRFFFFDIEIYTLSLYLSKTRYMCFGWHDSILLLRKKHQHVLRHFFSLSLHI